MYIQPSSVCFLLLALVVWCEARSADVTSTKYIDQTQNEVESKYEKDVGREHDLTLPVNERYPSAVLVCGVCGGTIISPTWVLTGAHCTLSCGRMEIKAGTNNTRNYTGVTRNIKRLVIHPLFSVGPYWLNAYKFNFKQVGARWDLMLVELESPLSLDGTVIAAAELDGRSPVPPGERVGYAGFGTNSFGGSMRSEMHAMDLEVMSDEDCSAVEQFNPQDMLCARGRPPAYDSACNGDSGSGLISEARLLGVLSWAENDARNCEPGNRVVFTRVAAARTWIELVTKLPNKKSNSPSL